MSRIGEKAAAFERAGVNPSVAALSPSIAGKTAVKLAETLPGGGIVSGPMQKSLAQTEAALQRAATELGPVGNIETAGEAAKARITSWKGAFSIEAERLYTAVSEHMPRDMPVFLNRTQATLGELRSQFPTNPMLGDILTPASYERLQTALNSTGETVSIFLLCFRCVPNDACCLLRPGPTNDSRG